MPEKYETILKDDSNNEYYPQAYKLYKPRKINFTGDATNDETSFDGSQDLSINVNLNTVPYNKGGTGKTTLTANSVLATNDSGNDYEFRNIIDNTSDITSSSNGLVTGKAVKDYVSTYGGSSGTSDGNYYHSTGSWSGLTYTATANGGAPALAFTIPTGTSSTTVAKGDHTHSGYASTNHTHSGYAPTNHTHTLLIVSTDETPTINLSSNTTYKLFAGGNTLVFKTPVDNTGSGGGTTYSGGTYINVNSSTISHKTSGVTAGTYGPGIGMGTEVQNGDADIDIPSFKVDTWGHITNIWNHTYTIKAQNYSPTYETNTLTVNTSATISMSSSSGTVVVVDSSGKLCKQSSTRNAKKEINYINNYDEYHNALMNFKPVTFIYKSDDTNTLKLGMIAEDVYEECNIAGMENIKPIYKELTEEEKENNKKPEIIDYEHTGEITNYDDRAVITMLVMEVQRLNKEIKELKNK